MYGLLGQGTGTYIKPDYEWFTIPLTSRFAPECMGSGIIVNLTDNKGTRQLLIANLYLRPQACQRTKLSFLEEVLTSTEHYDYRIVLGDFNDPSTDYSVHNPDGPSEINAMMKEFEL